MTRVFARVRAGTSTALQIAGGGAAAAGLYLLAGLAWALLAAGLAVAAVSVLVEWAERKGGR